VDARHVWVDDGVPFAHDEHIKRISHSETVAAGYGFDVQTAASQQVGYRPVGPDPQIGCGLRRRAQLVWDDVVDVLMGDQNGIGAVECIWRRERPWIDHQCDARLLESHTSVAQLAQPHGLNRILHPAAGPVVLRYCDDVARAAHCRHLVPC